MPPDHDATILVGISGVSSSGKTTVSRLLRDIFPSTFVLHQDDFYKSEDELPTKHGFLDWDCAEAISVQDMDHVLAHIRSEGSTPSTFASKEDKNTVGSVPISESCIEAQKARVKAWLEPSQPGHALLPSSSSPPPSPPPRVCILDGFLLYTPAMAPATRHLHAKLLLLASRDRTLARRAARDGYVTLEGFWTDPPGYVEKIVWPNYAESHAWLFKDGDVEAGVLDPDVLSREGIEAIQGHGQNFDLDTVLEWAVGQLMAAVEAFLAGRAT